MRILIRCQRLVPHEDNKDMLTFKETFVSVPDFLFENALKEKKNLPPLEYGYLFAHGYLHDHDKLIDFITSIVGSIDRWSIERIHPYSEENKVNKV